MGSDRARETFDARRQYRRVVQQQGRVVLEADANEAQVIVAEEMRRELLDVIGPHGVPRDPITGELGNGYRVHTLNLHTHDFQVGAGSIYAGGWSVEQHGEALTYGNQPDWRDGPAPPLAEIKKKGPAKEIVYLRLREQEVSAVEDPTLLEPALGGPDTAQRVRLVRRVGRAAVAASHGPVRPRTAFQQIDWGSPGIVLRPDQAALCRTALLTVSFDPTSNAYAGSENQMIRVQGGGEASANPAVATQLLWAYNNGASLYSAALPDPKNLTTLKLLTLPVDVAHQPKSQQYAEVLLAAVDLGSGAYIAAPSGALVRVGQAYDPKTQTIGLQSPLPATYVSAAPLFVRIWENSIDVAAASGASAALVDANGNATGLQVELTDETNKPASVVPGDYWSFAVRPSAPKSIFPDRYTRPQPPDGPREWAAPLAVIDWNRKTIIDGRTSFTNLTTQSNIGGCCQLALGPRNLKEMPLREWIESLEPTGDPVTICLAPGCYELEEPIILGAEHARITIEACGGRAEFMAAEHAHERFRNGLVQLHEADAVTLRGLTFVLPEASFGDLMAAELAGFDPASPAARHTLFKLLRSMRLAIGLHVGACADLTIEHCSFGLQQGHAHRRRRPNFGGCIVASGDVRGLHVRDCRFRANREARDEEPHLLFGYLHAPTASDERALLVDAAADRHEVIFTHAEFEGYSTSLEEAEFHRNRFDGLTAAALVLGHVGHLSISENRVSDGYGGFWIFARNGDDFQINGNRDFEEVLARVPADPYVYWGLALARCLERPPPFQNGDIRHSCLTLHVNDNAADVVSTAIIGWHIGEQDRASAIVNANRLASTMQAMPTGTIVTVPYVSITGNVLLNHSEAEKVTATALIVIHGRGDVQVSGNAHKGLIKVNRSGAETGARPPAPSGRPPERREP